jgi:hypothetical protein
MIKKFYSGCSCKSVFVLTGILLLNALHVFAQPLKVGVAGLNHDHAYGLMINIKMEK